MANKQPFTDAQWEQAKATANQLVSVLADGCGRNDMVGYLAVAMFVNYLDDVSDGSLFSYITHVRENIKRENTAVGRIIKDALSTTEQP